MTNRSVAACFALLLALASFSPAEDRAACAEAGRTCGPHVRSDRDAARELRERFETLLEPADPPGRGASEGECNKAEWLASLERQSPWMRNLIAGLTDRMEGAPVLAAGEKDDDEDEDEDKETEQARRAGDLHGEELAIPLLSVRSQEARVEAGLRRGSPAQDEASKERPHEASRRPSGGRQTALIGRPTVAT